jgi:hypothetical protein
MMISRQLNCGLAVTVLAVLMSAGQARGGSVYGTVEAAYNGNGPTETARIDFDFGTVDNNLHVYVGRSDFTVMEIGNGDGDVVSPGLADHFTVGQTFRAFCVDFEQTIDVGDKHEWELVSLAEVPYPHTSGNPMGVSRANWLRNLYQTNYSSVAASDANAAAFQLAAWHLIYEAKDSVTDEDVNGADNEHFRVNQITSSSNDASIYNLANTWIADAKAPSTYTDVYALRSADTQDFAVVLDGFEPEALPAPTSVLAGMMLLATLAIRRRTRRRLAA